MADGKTHMSMGQRALLVINPISGTTSKRGLDREVMHRLEPLGWNIDVAWTSGHGDATCLANDAIKHGYDSVIAAGGDGTINEVARALRDSTLSLGIIPCGSGNGLARHLQIPIHVRSAIEVKAGGPVERCDYGSVNQDPFFCTFGVGFDAAVSQKFALSRRRGKLSYIRNTFEEYIRYASDTYQITANGKVLTEKAFLVAVCNASQYGNNAYIAPYASMTDGLLDVTIIHSGYPITTALVGVDLLTGYIDRNTLVHCFRTSAAVIERIAEGPAHIDGEPLTLGKRLEVKCHSAGLSVYTPATLPRFKPIITPLMSTIREWRLALRDRGTER